MPFGVRVPLNVMRHSLRLAGGLDDGRRKCRPMRLMRHILELCGKVHGTIPKIRIIKLVLSPMEARRACATKLNLSSNFQVCNTIYDTYLKNQNSCPLAHDKSISIAIEWSRRSIWLVVP